jgi:hypothetical protein
VVVCERIRLERRTVGREAFFRGARIGAAVRWAHPEREMRHTSAGSGDDALTRELEALRARLAATPGTDMGLSRPVEAELRAGGDPLRALPVKRWQLLRGTPLERVAAADPALIDMYDHALDELRALDDPAVAGLIDQLSSRRADALLHAAAVRASLGG